MDQVSLFIEQAEYIEPDYLLRWSIDHPDEDRIIRKLSHGGAKLITGPRGCGKTTLMLKTFHNLCQDVSYSTLPIYVNFKSSLKLEPLYQRESNATFIFNQWIMLKIYQGLYKTMDVLGITYDELVFSKKVIDDMTSYLELGKIDILDHNEALLSVPLLEKEIGRVLNLLNKKRCVLLLDDAAHAFSVEQQRDFFDFFRQIKSSIISPKAAIYPGVTSYSPNFHVGHDAEEIDVWIKPESDEYLTFMTNILKSRLPPQVFNSLYNEQELFHLICYASFGMPRALLNMARCFYNENAGYDSQDYQVKFNRKIALDQVKLCIDNTIKIFSSLKAKLPIYKNFISNGELLFEKMSDTVKEYNKNKDADHQSVAIAIPRPIPSELNKVIGFFQYSGLLLPLKTVSRGEKGIFEIYSIHYSALIDKNALFGKKAINILEYVHALETRNPHEFSRISPSKLMGTDDASRYFVLSLPACQICKAPRVNESAKFCSNCGATLTSVSVFDTMVNNDISNLPLTPDRIRKIKRNSTIRTIKDILMDHDYTQLRGVHMIGPVWTKRIFAYAEEYLG